MNIEEDFRTISIQRQHNVQQGNVHYVKYINNIFLLNDVGKWFDFFYFISNSIDLIFVCMQIRKYTTMANGKPVILHMQSIALVSLFN